MKKILISVLCLVLLTTSFAFADHQEDLTSIVEQVNENHPKVVELINEEVPAEIAIDLVKVELITKKMESSGEVMETKNGKVLIETKGQSVLSKTDKDYIIDKFQNVVDLQNNNVGKSKKEKIETINALIAENPQESNFSVSDEISEIKVTTKTQKYDPETDSWIEVKPTTESPSKELLDLMESQDEIRSSGYKQSIEEVMWIHDYENGYYNTDYVMEQYGAGNTYYAKIWIKQYYTISAGGQSAPYGKIHIDSIQGGQSAAGIIGVNNGDKSISRTDTPYNSSYTIPARVENEAIYNITGSIGISLFGPFSFSVSTGGTWTQYAIMETYIGKINKIAAVFY